MIISPKKRKPSTVSRLLSWVGFSSRASIDSEVLSPNSFRLELEKERCRVDRQGPSQYFSVLLVQGIAPKFVDTQSELLVRIHQRLRIIDSIGWCEGKLGIVLPETNRQGATKVASDIEQIAEQESVSVNIEIIVYPDDDEIAKNALEFQMIRFESKQTAGSNGPRLDGEVHGSSAQDQTDGTALFLVTPAMPLWKRVLDISGSSIGLVCLSPVFLSAAAAVKLSGPGPVFFRQLREGKNGVPFFIYKFRTMIDDAESLKNDLQNLSEQDGPAFKLEHDPRLTKIGKYLRKSCIDELPQLLNVLLGQMSLVGPRPLPVNESYECTIWQRKRLEVVPGLTCIWQVRGNRNTKFTDWMRMDMEYIRRRSLLLDIKLIFETAFVALLHRGSV